MQTHVLILADGIVAKHLLQRVVKSEIANNVYHIVYTDPSIRPENQKENIYYYQFDPTSFVKLSKLFNKRYNQVVIVLGNKIDTVASFENVRRLDANVNILVLDRWDLQLSGKNYILLNANEVLANRVMDYFPNVPVIAQNVGLGLGEIMEVLVPFGSSYIYRHIGTIEQKNWKIAAIYRNNRLILPRANLMILPNDILLLVGDPDVLKNVYRSIKREVGQFPMPFGRNSYLLIDMRELDTKSIRHLVLSAVYIHNRFKDRRLFIRVVYPNDFELLRFIKQYDGDTIEVMIDYRYRSLEKNVKEDLQKSSIGLFMLHHNIFMKKHCRKLLYELKIPIFSLANSSFSSVKELELLLTQNRKLETISSVVFDIAIQLKISLKLVEYLEQSSEETQEIVEHFENLANIFSKPITIQKTKENPIRLLQHKRDLLLVYPFTEKVVDANPYNIFCTDPEGLFYKLGMHHQMFIPVNG